ncbi:MAG: SDR family oxidoreductase [Ectothiorhodospiraceae bacterium]|nr:SDR family oxidoreductase [Ectothiorhodospiraceae bacterium]TVQ46821.1 MAG: SDR family oxidoreductase [Gammaproteobacteria bacterium]
MSRRWIVTGGSRGMGLATARIATARGDRVAVLARNIDVSGLSEAIGEEGVVLHADVSNPESVTRAVTTVVERWGGVDVLVNNAGLHRGGRAADLPLEDWQAVLDTNLSGPLYCVRAVLPHMPEGGSIVNVGAVVGFRGFPGDSAYGASKAGLAGLTRVLAMELARQKLRVNLVVPGLVLTEMVAELDDRARERLIAKIPLRRMGSEEEIAEVIWWVAGSSYMTGAVIPTDGGLMCAL